jgi:hypothetical protein
VNNFCGKKLLYQFRMSMWKRDMNYANSKFVDSAGEVVVTLDCETVKLPSGRRSLNSIRSYLETVALANRRILGELLVDGASVDLSLPLDKLSFRRVDAVTISLSEQPVVLLTTAAQQVKRARESVDAALTLVLINDPATGRELWWKVAGQLKEPVLTLSLMPENLCRLWCGTTFQRLREWQLEQISMIVRRVDEACDSQDAIQLSDALEKLVLPWLDKLAEHIQIWQDATQAGARLALNSADYQA